jgi:hypothetical protein
MAENNRVLYVTDKNGAILTKLRERDGVSECYVDNKQNAESTLTFSMLINSDKYEFLSNAENLVIADGKVYTQLYDGDSVNEKKDNGNKNSAEISLVERQYLLGKAYVTAYNSTTTYDHIDNTMVVILSGGTAALNVNGTEIANPYDIGTAAYALYAILYGSGWTVGTVDVDGTFDLETSKKSILDNVKSIQELWGGILVFNSYDKIVHLRSETVYQPYNGYGVRFRFNETGLERNITKNIVTRLYVYGKDGLNISSSNNGLEYLENYDYTSTPLYGLIENNDISNVGDLITYGTRELEKLCKPQVTLKISLIDRSRLEGGISFDVSDMVDVADEDLSDSRYRARVTEKKYNFFEPWECSSVTLGDEEEVFTAKIKYALNSADKVNNLVNLVGQVSSDNVTMSGTRQTMTSYVQLTNEALEAGFKVVGVDGYERTGKTKISVDGIDVYNGGVVIRDRENDIRIYMDGTTGNIIFSGDLYGACGTFAGALEAATGTFAGELSAATGSFSGEITAASGKIGSWEILDGGIVNENNNLALTSDGEIVAARGNFQVDEDGKLMASGAEITGAFSASTDNSTVEFSDDTMLIYFADEDGAGNVNSCCRISPTEFYFKAFENGIVTSAIEYANGQLEITGKITASSGEIGGWEIGEDFIKATNGCMVLHADGTIEGQDTIDEHGNTVSGSLVSKTGNEKTVIKGGRINMYCYDSENEQWVPEGSFYTNSNFGGGLCLEAKESRPIVFAVGGTVVMKLEPSDYDGNTSGNTRLNFRNGTYIYKDSIETGHIDETDPEWFSNIAVSDSTMVFTSGNRTVANEDTAKTYSFTLSRDTDGKIVTITDENNNVTTITRS